MTTQYEIKGDTLIIYAPHEIDHHSASVIIEYSDIYIAKNNIKNMTIDFENTAFMDSSGIGIVIGRYKIIKRFGGRLTLKNMNKNIERMFEISGVKKLLEDSCEYGR
ncbi:MAG: STAS domain-containing protein [Lachnospiraceae bacterium]|nr:STAS domain-containing protein [Lachnospiraceae bacterium]